MNALEIHNLTKSFAGFKLDDVSLTLPSGCIMGLIGENGAGKSTTIKLILDILHKDSGTVTLRAVEAQRRGGHSGSLLRTVFPGRKSLQGRYPYLKRYPVLLPVAWGQRIWAYGREAGKRGDGAAESLKTANRRLELLRQYQIIK